MKTMPLLLLMLTACEVPAIEGPDGGGSADIDAATSIDAGVPDAGSDPGIVDPGIISALPGDGFQAEPTVAAGPDGMRVVSWLSYPQALGRYQVSYAVSADRGVTFGKPRFAATPDGWWARSPVLTTGPDGMWLTWPAIHLSGQARDDVRILASHIAFGATELEDPIVIDDGSMQVRYGPSAVVTASKTLIVAYTESDALIARRDVNGDLARTALNAPGIPSLCTDGTRVYATVETAAGVVLRWSDDDGRTWPTASAHTFDPDPALAAVQPRCAAAGGQVWVVYGATDSAGSGQELLTGVLISHSKDRAVTWASEVDVKPADYSYAMLPNIVATADRAVLAFYVGETAGDPNGATALVRVSDTLEATMLVPRPILFETARTPPLWQGDALGVSAYDGHLDVAYADDTGTASHVGLFGIDAWAVGQ